MEVGHSAQTSTEAAPSSQLFQNAENFEIRGGQFVQVQGDVHNYNTFARPNLEPIQTTDEFFSDGEIYSQELLRQKRGFPLYTPGPLLNTPAEYRKYGVAIGDVGRVTPDGIFDFFFNIYLPADDPINVNRVPEGFIPLPSYSADDMLDLDYEPGEYVSTSSICDTATGEFPGSEFQFSCTGKKGAILVLPHGAHVKKLQNLETLRQYAAKHAYSWYQYVNGPKRGRGLENGTLCLITGCEKAHSWGIATFQRVTLEMPADVQLRFRPTTSASLGYKYRWHSRGTPSRQKYTDAPLAEGVPPNQTTFIHAFTISLGESLWSQLLGKVQIHLLGGSGYPGKAGSGLVPYSSRGSSFSWTLNLFGSGTSSGSGQSLHEDSSANATLSDASPIAKVINPSQTINEIILREIPQAAIVISHSDDWQNIPWNNIQKIQDFESLKAIKEANGLVYPVKVQAPSETQDIQLGSTTLLYQTARTVLGLAGVLLSAVSAQPATTHQFLESVAGPPRRFTSSFLSPNVYASSNAKDEMQTVTPDLPISTATWPSSPSLRLRDLEALWATAAASTSPEPVDLSSDWSMGSGPGAPNFASQIPSLAVEPMMTPRRRTVLACVNCRQRKVKCLTEDSSKPCMRCKTNRLPCEYLASDVSAHRAERNASLAPGQSAGTHSRPNDTVGDEKQEKPSTGDLSLVQGGPTLLENTLPMVDAGGLLVPQRPAMNSHAPISSSSSYLHTASPAMATSTAVSQKRSRFMPCKHCRRRHIRCMIADADPNPCARCVRKGLVCELVQPMDDVKAGHTMLPQMTARDGHLQITENRYYTPLIPHSPAVPEEHSAGPVAISPNPSNLRPPSPAADEE